MVILAGAPTCEQPGCLTPVLLASADNKQGLCDGPMLAIAVGGAGVGPVVVAATRLAGWLACVRYESPSYIRSQAVCAFP